MRTAGSARPVVAPARPWLPVALQRVVLVAVTLGLLGPFFYRFSAVLVAAYRAYPDVSPDDPWVLGLTAAMCLAWARLAWRVELVEALGRSRVRRWAAVHGWSTDVAASRLVGRWDSPPFGPRASRTARTALSRSDERGTVYSFTYADSRGDPRHVVMTECAMLGPALWLTPEGPAERRARAMGGQDIAVEWARFSDRWRVRSGDLRFAHAVLHPRLLERLMEPDTAYVSVLLEGGDGAGETRRIAPARGHPAPTVRAMPRADVTFASPGLVFVVGLVAVAAVIAGGFWYQHKRHQKLAAWAASAGWTYRTTDPRLVTLSGRAPFGLGYSQRVREVLSGRWRGAQALSFTYRWKTRSGTGDHRHEETHTVHVVALALPTYLPIVELTPEGFLDRFAAAIGAQDIRFELEEFNRTFRVQSSDERTAHAIIHPRLMERLLQPDARRMSWRTDGTWILSWQNGATDLGSLASRLGVLSAIVASIPRHVWQDHGHDPLVGPGR